MYFDDYENYYNEPSEVDELFNEFSEKLKTMLKNEVVENAKKYDINKDEIKTAMNIANGLKEEYEQKLEELDNEISKAAQEQHNKWLEKLLHTDIKPGDMVYKVYSNGYTYLTCPYCENGKVKLTLGDKVASVNCPICNDYKPSLPKYEYKKVRVRQLNMTLTCSDKNEKATPYVDRWIDEPNYPFDKMECIWCIKDENWDTLTSDRTAKTEEQAKLIIDNLNKEQIQKLEEKYGKENVKEMLHNIGENK